MENKNTTGTGDFREYFIQSLRDDPELASEYFNAAMEDGDVRIFLLALSDIAKASGMLSVSVPC